jgi:hypothetical protein
MLNQSHIPSSLAFVYMKRSNWQNEGLEDLVIVYILVVTLWYKSRIYYYWELRNSSSKSLNCDTSFVLGFFFNYITFFAFFSSVWRCCDAAFIINFFVCWGRLLSEAIDVVVIRWVIIVVVDVVDAVVTEGGCENNAKRESYSGRSSVSIDSTSSSSLLNGSLTWVLISSPLSTLPLLL